MDHVLVVGRFLSNYPETPPLDDHIEIGLDEVAKNLSKWSESNLRQYLVVLHFRCPVYKEEN